MAATEPGLHMTGNSILPCRHRDSDLRQLGIRQRTIARTWRAQYDINCANQIESCGHPKLPSNFSGKFGPGAPSGVRAMVEPKRGVQFDEPPRGRSNIKNIARAHSP